MSLNFQEAQFKDLKEADGTGAHDDGVGFNHVLGFGSNGEIVFNSHDARPYAPQGARLN